MPTIIDSLLVTLGIDAGPFNKGKAQVDKSLKQTGDEAEKAGKKLKQTGKDGADGFNELAAGATKFLAVLGGAAALTHFIENTIEATTQMARFSRNLGDSASNVNAWSNAAELAGGSAGGLQSTLDKLSMAQTELEITGSSSLVPYLSSLGIAFGAGISPAQQLLELSDRFARMDRTKANNLGRTMGIDQGTMNLLLKGRPEVELMIKRQKELNDVNTKQTEVSERLTKAFTEGKQSFSSFGRELMMAVAPALEKALALFSALGEWMRENKEFVEIFLTIVAVGLGAIGAALIPINMVAVGVLALGAAIAALYQDYQVWKRGGDSLINWAAWEPGIKAAGAGVIWLRDLVADAFYRMFAAVDMVKSALSGDWERAKFAAGEFKNGNGKPYGAPASDTTTQRTSSGKIGRMGPQAFFESKGWTAAQAAGIVANLQSESGINASAVGDSGKAYGIAQWHPDRQAAFARWAGHDIKGSTAEEQMAFVHYELTEGNEKGAGAALRSATTAQQAGELVSSRYERPANGEAEARKRGLLAMGIPGAAGAAQGVGASSSARMAQAASQGAGNRSSETSISEMNIYTQATDANGIATDIGKSIDNLYTSQFNYGLDG